MRALWSNELQRKMNIGRKTFLTSHFPHAYLHSYQDTHSFREIQFRVGDTDSEYSVSENSFQSNKRSGLLSWHLVRSWEVWFILWITDQKRHSWNITWRSLSKKRSKSVKPKESPNDQQNRGYSVKTENLVALSQLNICKSFTHNRRWFHLCAPWDSRLRSNEHVIQTLIHSITIYPTRR